MPTIHSSTPDISAGTVPADGRVFRSVNPADLSDTVAEVVLTDVDGLLGAFRAAKLAQGAWAATPAPVRGQVIAAFGRLVESNAERLAALVTREVGKPLAESRGEVQEVIDTCTFFAGEGRRLYGQTVPSEMPNKQLFTFREPVGVVVTVTAGNFPVAVPSWYLVPALLCGNTVVWKPAEYSAACADALLSLARAAGVPAGVLEIVHADGATTFEALSRGLESALVDKVGFTGSSEVGVRIGELCGRHLQTPCLELGGKNPMIVAADADLDLAVQGALFSGFGTAGQRCTSLGTAIVHESVHDAFVARLGRAVDAAIIGDPRADVLFGPLISEVFASRFEDYLSWIQPHHRTSGSTATGRICAENPRRGFVGDPEKGHYYHPVVVTGLRPDDELFLRETFGPIIGVTTYRGLDEAIELANRPGYGLSSSVYTHDPATVFGVRRGVRAGMLSVNNSTSGAEAHLPFGGNGRSGNGSRQSGIWVLDQFSRWQAVNWDYSGGLQRAQIDTGRVAADPDFRLAW